MNFKQIIGPTAKVINFQQCRGLLRPPKNLPFRGVYRKDGEVIRQGDIIVNQFKMNYHPGMNVYYENDRGEKLLRAKCDGVVRISREKCNPDFNLPEMKVYEYRKDVDLYKLTFNMDANAEGPNIERDVQRILELIEHVQKTGEVSNPKIASLQNALRSDFFNVVREVYETVYETIDVDGSPEVKAAATAKATVAAFAAAEGHAHPRIVELPKTDQGLGFNVMGGKEQNSPIYISRIIPGGVADRHGDLKRGDQLIAVNGINVESECHEKAVDLLKSAVGSVKLVVRYTPKLLDEMERRFERQRLRSNQQSPQLPIPSSSAEK
ncbi:unnamed protein product [Caenorhabditis bovis]|uniref:Protein lin-7 homolog B n=1 Tax=Caenorhabditis bovis TaxID=2654633 RepID=A0A8S1FEN5_9PELO|nr:unnamed protein product [Caenorhabditis bovis]